MLTPEADVDLDDLKIDTLSGDLRDALLAQVRNLRRPWSMLAGQEQRELSNVLETAAKELVRQAVRLLTDYDFPRCAVTLGEVKIKGEKGIEAKIATPNVETYRNILGNHVGQTVLMLMVDSETFMGERAPVSIKPDQGSLDVSG